METKLTLKLDSVIIRRAKKYIRGQKGYSLSKVVEKYFNSLTKNEMPGENKMSPIVAGLAGAARKTRVKNIKKEYTNYLIEKYK
jgi:Family of unknown function (DUF6364)